MNVELSLHDPFRNFYEAIRADNRTPQKLLVNPFSMFGMNTCQTKAPISWIRELKIFELFLKKDL